MLSGSEGIYELVDNAGSYPSNSSILNWQVPMADGNGVQEQDVMLHVLPYFQSV